jgi:hypothetical protein
MVRTINSFCSQQANLVSPPALVCSLGLDITLLSEDGNGDDQLDENSLPEVIDLNGDSSDNVST